MESFVCSLEKEDLSNMSLVLFGSYDWGDGEWMRVWEERMKKTGARLLEKGLIFRLEPDEAGMEQCRKLGERIFKESERVCSRWNIGDRP